MGTSAHPTVKKLVLATQLAIYRDVIPGYRIRPIEDAPDSSTKVSKEVRRLRSFEQSLVSGYQSYVRELSCLARTPKDGMSAVAVSCACALLSSVPHFNFRGDLLQILVTKLSARGKVDADFVRCRQTIETLFREDEDGTPSLDATSLLTKMMRARGYRVDESVLNTFLHLRLLSEFSSKGSQNRIDPSKEAELSRGGKKIQPKRTFRTKKQRKQAKETKVVEEEMKEADASVSHEERDRMQAETLKLVFVTYFRILKLGVPSLMGAVLEGLAKYAHLINQDFFADLLEALKDLIQHSIDPDAAETDADDDGTEDTTPRNPSRESLLCVITAFALLQGQSISLSTHTTTTTALNLDLHFFITHLYTTLHPLSLSPDLELSARSLHLPDPSSRETPADKRVNHTTTIVLLLRCLSHTLTPPPPTPARSVSPTRLAAFVKQLMTISLQLPEKSALAVLHLLHKALKLQGRRLAGLWRTEERRGEGVWNGDVAGGWEGKNPFCATVWEGELLRVHYCHGVREGAKMLERVVEEVK